MYHQFANHVLRVHTLYSKKIIRKSDWMIFCAEVEYLINVSEYSRNYKLSRPQLTLVWKEVEHAAALQREAMKAKIEH